MSFEESIKEGYVKEVETDKIRAKSLVKSSKQAIDTAKLISLNKIHQRQYLGNYMKD